MKAGKRASKRPVRAIKTKEAPVPGGHYSQAISVGGHIYLSGSGPFDPKTHKAVVEKYRDPDQADHEQHQGDT
jgi:enamine deaminase RidA (YjgF/YER057c/UK114 family)